jgi:ribonuclease HI
MDANLILEFDGGSRGNPGPAGIGIVVRAADGTALVTLGQFIGFATNNVAEYKALVAGLNKVIELGGTKVHVRGDSELVIKQLKGEYRVRHPDLRPLYERAMELLSGFASVKLEHNQRHKNHMADKLANLAMDQRAEVTEIEPGGGEGHTVGACAKGQRLACPRCHCVVEVCQASRSTRLSPFTCQCGAKMAPAGGN